MRSEDVLRALKRVPEAHLRLIDLAWELYRDGELDEKKATLLSKEIEEAAKEAEDYARATREAIWALKKALS